MIVVKVILYALLIILLLLLAIVLFALLSRIRFDIQAAKNGSPRLRLKLSWLLTSLRFGYELGTDGGKLHCTLLWFDLTKKRDKKEKDKSKKTKRSKHKSAEKSAKHETDTIPLEITATAEADPKEKDIIEEKKEKAKNKNPLTGIKSAYESYRKFADYPDKDLIFEYILQLIGELLRAIGFKKFSLNATVGLGDPSLTGMTCALAYSVCGMAGLGISLEMDCENEVLAVDCRIRGRTSLWAFTWPLIKFALRKPIWRIIKKQLFGKDEKHEHRHEQQH